MGHKKCPICELNYIAEDQKYCEVCKRNIKGEPDIEETELMCTECGESIAVNGGELCAACLQEARRQEKIRQLKEENKAVPESIDIDKVELDDIEVPLPVDGEIPENELEEIDKELSDGVTDDDYDDFDENGGDETP